MMLAVGVSQMPFIRLGKFSLIPNVLGVFIIKGCWILSNDFSVFIEIIVGFPPLYSAI